MLISIFLLFLLNLLAMNNNYQDYNNDNYYTYDVYLDMIEEDEKIKKLDSIWMVICYVESSFDEMAYNESELAVGIIQIRPIMVDEINLILGKNKYNLKDRWCKEKSFEMFKIYQDFINPEYNETLAARFWNGGRTGDKKRSTDVYVEKYFERKNQLYSDDFLLAEK